MGTINAVAFSLLGALMGFLPALLPSYFPSSGIGGMNTSELWLEFMGVVQASLGIFYFIRNGVLPAIVRLVSWSTAKGELTEQPQRGVILRPVSVAYLNSQNTRERSVAA